MTTSTEVRVRDTRPISWIAAALREFRKFPEEAQTVCERALSVAAEGGMADNAKPMHGFGSGVFEIALPFRGDAISGSVRGTDRREGLGDPRIPEEVEQGNQDTRARVGSYKSAAEMDTGAI